MSPAPAVPSVAAELYRSLLPLAYDDERQGWALLYYLAAIGGMLQEIDDLVRDSDDGPGWSVLVDVDRSPAKALGWLAQFVGVTLSGSDVDVQRQQIRDASGMRRGTLASLKAAARQHLVGDRTVLVNERYGSAYRLQVITYAAQTPNQARVLAALLSQKPAGLVLEYVVRTGQTWQQLRDNHVNWLDVRTDYATWGDARDDMPTGP